MSVNALSISRYPLWPSMVCERVSTGEGASGPVETYWRVSGVPALLPVVDWVHPGSHLSILAFFSLS